MRGRGAVGEELLAVVVHRYGRRGGAGKGGRGREREREWRRWVCVL
uniref:Uncharacterized protein n=1 Tax=Arundo donax TaxID=35708 RepID=A0A0A9FAC7_ARUDO